MDDTGAKVLIVDCGISSVHLVRAIMNAGGNAVLVSGEQTDNLNHLSVKRLAETIPFEPLDFPVPQPKQKAQWKTEVSKHRRNK